MRMIIIAVAALVVLGGGGAAAYFYFSQSAEAAAGEEAGEGHDELAEKEEEAKKDKEKGDYASEFVELDPLILPIVDGNGVNQTVSLVIAIEVASSDAKGTVEKYEPKLKDAYIEHMYGMLNKHAAFKGGVIQISQIKKKLNKITDKVLGEDVAEGVFLQVVQQRPI